MSDFITLGAGCFWGVEAIFQKQTGVTNTECGYCAGELDNPTYEDICTGNTGHAEVVKVYFDDSTNLESILDIFWRLHDPTTLNRQGYDIGTQYRSAIFYNDESQKEIAESSLKQRQAKINQTIVTEITPLANYYPAEDYHQDYYLKKYQGMPGPICHVLQEE